MRDKELNIIIVKLYALGYCWRPQRSNFPFGFAFQGIADHKIL